MTITGENTKGYEISVRWNRYLGTLVVDVELSGKKILVGRALRFGNQSIIKEINANVYDNNGLYNPRYFGDILDANIDFYSGCSRG